MHTIVRYYIRTSLIFLALGLLLGGYFLIATYWLDSGYPSLWVTAHVHVILMGFVIMMIMGVAQWMFPRPTRNDSRYSPGLALTIFYLYTLSTALRFLAEVLAPYGGDLFNHIRVVASLLQILIIALFFYNMRSRIRPTGSQFREAKGEKF